MKTPYKDLEARRARLIALNKSRAIPVEQRLWSRAGLTNECFIWTGVIGKTGYGGIQVDGKRKLVHRVAYELTCGEIPEKLTLDHLCRNRACLNPMHLEPVTLKENTERGISANGRKTHCKYGHPFSTENTMYRSNGGRHCKRCHADRNYQGLKKRYKYEEQFK